MSIPFLFFDFFNSYHVQILIAELMFCVYFKTRIKRVYMFLTIAAYCVVPYLLQRFVNFDLVQFGGWFSGSYFLLYFISVVLIWSLFKISNLKELMFYCIAAMVIEHLVYALCATVSFVFPMDNQLLLSFRNFMVFIAVYAFFYFYFVRRLLHDNIAGVRSSFLIIFALVCISIVYVLSVWSRTNEMPTLSGCIFEVACCIFILLIHFGKFEQSMLERQNEEMQRILQQEEKQQRISAENITLINMKCHDIKYHISALKNLSSSEQQKSIMELERVVNIYDTSIKTCNDTLDALLSEKSLYWNEYNINFTCIADGSKLNFMLPADIYSMFGNALDNAIESVKKMNEKDKRIISLTISSKGNYVVITITNFYENEIILENELPKTTRQNNGYHGYGMKSIQYITHKYNGTLSIQTENDIFKLVILLPQVPIVT